MKIQHEDLPLMIAAAQEAGEAILRHYRPGETVGKGTRLQDKGEDNPLTQADLEADRILRQTLHGNRPDYGWLSEETADDPARLQRHRVWVVDPIDGTKEFIIGLPQFAISIGLVEDGHPVAACIFNPPKNELYVASRGHGAALNGHTIHTTHRASLDGATCLASRSETSRGEWNSFAGELELHPVGSIAYKLALVAAGRYDLTFTLTPKNEWDYCAGLLLVEEAGGRVTHKDGSRFRFNRPDPRTTAVLATNGPLHAALLERLSEVPVSPDRHRHHAHA